MPISPSTPSRREKKGQVKILNGRELAGFVKERQAHLARALRSEGKIPKLVIIRDSDNPVITKYVELKKRYGEDIGVEVADVIASGVEELRTAVLNANADDSVSGIIVQLPLKDNSITDSVVSLISPEKDVDGLAASALDPTSATSTTSASAPTSVAPTTPAAPPVPHFDSATATAINWLLSGYGIDLAGKKIAIVGRGRLVGGPLIRMWKNSGYGLTIFGRDGDLSTLPNFDVIVTATGKPRLITSEMVAPGAVVVDAGTASEDGVLVGDLDPEVRDRSDLSALTPKIGGVGPLTVSVLFENVLAAASAR